jgi:hypothetical protein
LNKRTIAVAANYVGLLASIVWVGISLVDIILGLANDAVVSKVAFHDFALAAIFMHFSLKDMKAGEKKT